MKKKMLDFVLEAFGCKTEEDLARLAAENAARVAKQANAEEDADEDEEDFCLTDDIDRQIDQSVLDDLHAYEGAPLMLIGEDGRISLDDTQPGAKIFFLAMERLMYLDVTDALVENMMALCLGREITEREKSMVKLSGDIEDLISLLGWDEDDGKSVAHDYGLMPWDVPSVKLTRIQMIVYLMNGDRRFHSLLERIRENTRGYGASIDALNDALTQGAV